MQQSTAPAAPGAPAGPGEPAPVLPEIGCYGLAGHSSSPGDLVTEAALADRMGIGAMFLSERFALKDAAVMAGAAVAATSRLGVGTAATNHNLRHPLVTATMAATLHRMSGGRYALGLGRGIPVLQDIMGLPRITSAQLEDVVGIYRTLWRGGTVAGHDGPAGTYPYLVQDASFDEDIPILFTAMGPRSLELAGRLADAVVLHTFFGDEATSRAVERVRTGAESAGRDPASVRVWSVMATVDEDLDEVDRLRKLVGRLATYLTGYGDPLVEVNGWDPAVLERFRADDRVSSFSGALDATDDVDLLSHVRELLPESWLATAAVGSPESCAERIAAQFDLGVDSVVLHGSTPAELSRVIPAWRARRAGEAFDTLPVNPGRMDP